MNRPRSLFVLATVVGGACGDAASPAAVAVDSTGGIRASITTVGVDLPTRYAVTVDGGVPRSVTANDSVEFVGLRKGLHKIVLGETGDDCTVANGASRDAPVGFNTTTFTFFDVTCWGRGLGNMQLAFTRKSDIYIMNLNGTGLVQLTTDGHNTQPAWSPDGRRIAFTSWRETGVAGSGDIYIMNADGSNVVRRTTSGAAYGPVWSPDSRRIAFTRWRPDGGDVYVASATDDGTTPIRLANGCFPDWSPDGGKIAFTAPNCNEVDYDDIHVMNADGSNITRVTDGAPTNTWYWEPAWSPDGHQIALTLCRFGCGVAVMNADGSALRIVGLGSRPRWSPKGRLIAFTEFADSPATLRGAAADGSFRGVIAVNAFGPSWRP
jgi:hypothetical protein